MSSTISKILASTQVNDEEGGSPIAIIVGGVVGIAVVVIVFVLTVVLIKQMRDKRAKAEGVYDEITDPPGNIKRDAENVYLSLGSSAIETSQTEDPRQSRAFDYENSMSIENFPENKETVQQPHLLLNPYPSEYYNSDQFLKGIPVGRFHGYVAHGLHENAFIREFKDLKKSTDATLTAELSENIEKNRFRTILPYDHTMVKLMRLDRSQSDYINASFSHGIVEENRYIATQGPLQNTVEDFWRMVWQYDVRLLVMLTNLEEHGKSKCVKYWPDLHERLQAGAFVISTTIEKRYHCYILRQIKMENKQKNKEERIVFHFHLTAWSEDTDPDPYVLAHFQGKVNAKQSRRQGPLVVHCGNGVGRTGVYIALDALLQEGKLSKRVNVPYFASKMRECRMNMIQKEEQYKLLHMALEEALRMPDSCKGVSQFLNTWKDVDSINIQQATQKEFEDLESCMVEDSRCVQEMAERDEESSNGRVIKTKDDKNVDEETKGLPSHSESNTIYTIPVPGNIGKGDFWFFTFRRGIPIIVHFNEAKDRKPVKWYPKIGEKLDTKEIIVSTLKEYHHSDAIAEYTLSLFSKRDQEDMTTSVIRVSIEKGDLPSASVLIKVSELLLDSRVKNAHTPCIITSSDGVSPGDVLCVIMNTIEQIQMDGEVDIYHNTRQLRRKRRDFINIVESYRRCYETVIDYSRSERMYCNMAIRS